MLNAFKTILVAVISAALAVLIEQLTAAAVSVFWQREIVLESYMHFTWFLAFAAVIEEISKYWAIGFVVRKNFGLEKMKLVLAALLLGAVWGISEIGLIFFARPEALSAFRTGNPEILFSFASIIALHALTAFLMGIFIAANTFVGRLKYLKILFFPILLHLLFNFLIIQKGDFTNSLIVLSLGVAFAVGILVFALNFRRLA